MTSAEYTDNSFENIHKWESLEKHVRDWIERASERIEKANPATIAKEMKYLNENLRAEGLIDLPMQVSTGLPMFTGRTLTLEGVEEGPVFPIDYMKQDQFEGTFRGCAARPVQSDTDMTLIFYDVEISEDENIHLEAPVDGSRVKIERVDADSWEEEVHAAFTVLETVDEEQYAECVNELRKAFWNTGESMLTRMKNLGFHSIALLSSELHKDPENELNEALGLILACSIDQDSLYEVRGVDMHETVNDQGQEVMYLRQMSRERIVKPIEIQYLTYFEVLGVKGEQLDVQILNAVQPVYIFFDPRERQEIAIPLRYFASIKESEHDEESLFSLPRPIGASEVGQYIQNRNGMTCGELSHEYMRREPGKKGFGRGALDNLDDLPA